MTSYFSDDEPELKTSTLGGDCAVVNEVPYRREA